MHRLKHLLPVVLVPLALVLFSVPALAGGKGAFIAIYNSGRALVRDARVVTLPKGLASVVIKDVPATLEPASVRVTAHDLVVYDLEYSYTPATAGNLLDRYIGKQISVILPDPSDANARILRKATLVANSDRPVFMVGNEVYIGDYEAILLPEMPGDLDTEPMLTMTTKSGMEGKKDVILNYLMGGLNWSADYAVTVEADGAAASVDAWATVNNTSGSAFQNADVRLVAGDVQRVSSPRPNYRAKAMADMEANMVASAPEPVEESFAQYHTYDLARPVSLPANGTKLASLFSASKVKVEQELISRFRVGGQQRGEIKQGAELHLKFDNTAVNNLGRPMPAGIVRVFMPTSEGQQLLAGEASIGHIAKDGEVELALGRSFDVTVERTQVDYKKLGKNAYEMQWHIVVKNAGDSPRIVKLHDSIPGEWKVLKAEPKYNRVDSGTIEFNLGAVPPTKGGAGLTIDYTVQVTY